MATKKAAKKAVKPKALRVKSTRHPLRPRYRHLPAAAGLLDDAIFFSERTLFMLEKAFPPGVRGEKEYARYLKKIRAVNDFLTELNEDLHYLMDEKI